MFSGYEDTERGLCGLSYKYSSKAIVLNSSNMAHFADVAYDGYIGGKDDRLVDSSLVVMKFYAPGMSKVYWPRYAVTAPSALLILTLFILQSHRFPRYARGNIRSSTGVQSTRVQRPVQGLPQSPGIIRLHPGPPGLPGLHAAL